MKSSVARWVALSAVWLASGGSALSQTAVVQHAGSTLPVLMLSDIHFDPFHDPSKVARLAQAPVQHWDAILSEPDSAGQAADYQALQTACKAKGTDSDIHLFRAALQNAKALATGVRFVTVSGDLLVHQFDCRYRTATAATQSLNTPQSYAAFAEKTASYVIERVEAEFAAAPVYVALGNNDSSCGDYEMDARDGFFKGTSAAVLKGLRGASPEDLNQAKAEYETGGYYSLPMAGGMEKTRLIAVEDITMSRSYTTCAHAKDSQQADAQVAWLNRELDKAQQRGERVWVLGHIPPGIDIYNTVRKMKDVCGGASAEMFLSSDALEAAIANHADVIRLAVFGHTHMDEWRLFGDVPAKLVPSISPVDGNLPAFTVAQIDAASATLKDYAVFTTPDGSGAGKWAREYGFHETYGATFSGSSLQGLVSGLEVDKDGQKPASQAYERFFSAGTASAKGSLLPLVWPQYACALGHATQEGYKQCVCATGKE